MVGLLRVKGQIDVTQFWPAGSSDADTTKVKVIVDANSFAFAADRVDFIPTHVFDDAFVRGASRKKLIDSSNRITVRLQGIDAPELHYRAGPLQRDRPEVTDKKRALYNQLNKVERRQYQAESATVALAKKLMNFGSGLIDCMVFSRVDHPYEVADTYGRFVGNIRVGSGFETDVNIWLAEEGWCYPTFYSSMETGEIEDLLAAMKKAGKKRVWKYLSNDASAFDPALNYRKPPTQANPTADKGPILMPKLFRRQVAYHMERGAKVFTGTFKKYLQSKPDDCFELEDFLKSGVHSASPRKFDEFLDGKTFTKQPQQIVFKEKFSTVVDAKGKVIKNF